MSAENCRAYTGGVQIGRKGEKRSELKAAVGGPSEKTEGVQRAVGSGFGHRNANNALGTVKSVSEDEATQSDKRITQQK